MQRSIDDDERLDSRVGVCADEQAEDIDSLTVTVDHDGLGQTEATLEYLRVQPNIRKMKQKITGIIRPKV